MSGIGSVTTAPAVAAQRPPRDTASATSLAADQDAATKAHSAAKKITATLVADQKAKATDNVIRVDQQAVTTANTLVQKADAKVKADQSASTRLSLTT